jgi:hypothetical protein
VWCGDDSSKKGCKIISAIYVRLLLLLLLSRK